MNDNLFALYEEELAFIREEIKEYGGRFSKVASRLKLSADSVEDPHVSRLVDSFALLTARIRLKIEDEFPEICQAMISALYPQYLAPTPSSAIAQFKLDAIGGELFDGIRLNRGSVLETHEVRGQACVYRTCDSLWVPPLFIQKSKYLRPPFQFQTEPTWSNMVQGAVRIELAPYSTKLDWGKTNFESLRFYLGGPSRSGNRLYETLLRDAVGVGLFSNKAKEGIFLGPNVISETGFGTEQGILDPDARVNSAFRFLWEFFALPEKFRFVDFRLAEVWPQVAAENLAIVIYLKRFLPHLQSGWVDDAIQLGCVPVTNLFEKDAEPIQLSETQVEYRVVPSYRSMEGMEVHTIRDVNATQPGGGNAVAFKPFHLPSHRRTSDSSERYWNSTRRRRYADEGMGDRGTEVYLSLVDLQSKPSAEEMWTLHVKTLCCNRDLPSHIDASIPLQFVGGPLNVQFVTKPTHTLRPVERDDWVWRLISHLSLNQLSLVSDADGTLLREILGLYNSQDQPEYQKGIDGILKIEYKRATARLDGIDKGAGFCRGLDITIDVDEERLEALGLYLFATVLDRFYSTLVSINSFTRLRVRGKSGELYRGVARCGTKMLI